MPEPIPFRPPSDYPKYAVDDSGVMMHTVIAGMKMTFYVTHAQLDDHINELIKIQQLSEPAG